MARKVKRECDACFEPKLSRYRALFDRFLCAECFDELQDRFEHNGVQTCEPDESVGGLRLVQSVRLINGRWV